MKESESNVVKVVIPIKNDKSMSRLKKSFQEGDFSEAIVIGYSPEGDFITYSNSVSRRDALWMLELAKLHVMRE